MYENFGRVKNSGKAKMLSKMSSPEKYEKESGSVYLSISINKKILDGKETTTISISKCGAETQEFTSVESFSDNIKSIVSGLKAKL